MADKDDIRKELEQIRKAHRGILRAEDVVEFARNPETSLHEKFQWDDTEAAKQYRLWQARQVISVYVTVLSDDSPPVKAYVSLVDDRSQPGGGYRAVADVMKDPERRTLLLQQALGELKRFQAKYRAIKELAGVFSEIDKVVDKHDRPAPAKKKQVAVGA